MTERVIGLLPVGGNGTRLGMPFPKPLSPIITDEGIVPLYRFALSEVREVADQVHAIVRPTTSECLISALLEDGVETVMTREQNLPAALGDIGETLSRWYGSDVMLATALPDSIWTKDPGKSMRTVLDRVRRDGALALFRAAANELDEVLLDEDRVASVATKSDSDRRFPILGWGAFIVRAGALAKFTDDQKDGPQLGQLDVGWDVVGSYVDLGTQDRYIRFHDNRRDR